MGNPHDTHPEYIKNEAKRLSKNIWAKDYPNN